MTALLLYAPPLAAQTEYRWIGENGASWQKATNWSPERREIEKQDILLFDPGDTRTVTDVPSEIIGALVVKNRSDITLEGVSGGPVTLTVFGTLMGDDLILDSGCSLTIGGSDGLTVAFEPEATAHIRGVIITGSNKVIVTNSDPGAVVITGGSINGEIERAIAEGSTGTYQFTDEHTRITPDGSQGAITVSVKSFPNTPIPEGNPDYAIKRYYTITPSDHLTGTLRLAYVDEELGLLEERRLSAWRWNGTAWVDEAVETRNETENWVEQTGISTWSNWTQPEYGAPVSPIGQRLSP